ncbi:MAG: hypothetical protein ACREOS_04690 [Candidatus Dormibacteraceae bacterium]
MTRSVVATWWSDDMATTPPESDKPNNLVKRIKSIGFGFRSFENYRIRALLYAGRPNWRVLGFMVAR